MTYTWFSQICPFPDLRATQHLSSVIPAVSKRSRKPEGPVPSLRTSTFSAYTLPRKQLSGIMGALKQIRCTKKIPRIGPSLELSVNFERSKYNIQNWYGSTYTPLNEKRGKLIFETDKSVEKSWYYWTNLLHSKKNKHAVWKKDRVFYHENEWVASLWKLHTYI